MSTNLIQKIHFQLAKRIITPPSIGPRIPEIPTTPPATAPIHFLIGRGKISGNNTIAIEYNPEPPIPWILLKTIS
jgi:hypothetical protein